MGGRCSGFTMVGVLIATVITTLVVGAILAVITPMQQAARVDGEIVDLHQRMRAAADALSTDIRAASAIRPYRVGALRDDGIAGVFYRADTITAIGAAGMKTYYLKPDSSQLMVNDGAVSDFPMVEHVTALTFEYFGGPPLSRVAAPPEVVVYEGAVRLFPMVEHVPAVTFEYFGAPPLSRLDAGLFADGPWKE